MNQFQIQILSQRQNSERLDWAKISEIFFLNSVKKFNSFNSEDERNKFLERWLLPYWESAPDYFYFLICNNKIVGYLSGHPDTTLFIANNKHNIHVSYLLFQQYHQKFPAHLHINLHPDYTGIGAGELLMQEFITRLRNEKSSGFHIVTAPDARNRNFYRKIGLKFEIIEQSNNVGYLFMGMELSAYSL